MPDTATLLMRLEGPMQAWGGGSKWVVRETDDTPTLSGVIGIICCALGRGRDKPLDDFRNATMAVRVDREGLVMRDYHTVGAGIGCLTAEGKIKITEKTGQKETLISDRYYLADASFLVALAVPTENATKWAQALGDPVWPPFLGRKCCPPTAPLLESPDPVVHATDDLLGALKVRPWRPRLEGEEKPERFRVQLPAMPGEQGAFPRADVPVSFKLHRHGLRYVREVYLPGSELEDGEPLFESVRDASEYVNYRSPEWRAKSREARASADWMCCFCGLPAEHAHHTTYRHAGDERQAELRALCHLCHDAVTMLEAERDMYADRIDPISPAYHDLVLETRDRLLKERMKREYRRGRLKDVLRVISGS